jgi:O-antigen/teichoic acid export membrane protein
MKAAVSTLAMKLLNACLGVILSVVMARALGVEGFGQFSFAVAVATVLSVPTLNGLSSLVTRETARAVGEDNVDTARLVFRWAVQCGFLYSLCAGAIVAGLFWLMGILDGAMASSTLLACLLLPALAVMGASAGALRGHFHSVPSVLPELVIWPALTIMFMVLRAEVTGNITPHGALALHVVACSIAAVAGYGLLRARSPAHSGLRSAVAEPWQWFRLALPLAAVAGLLILNRQISLVILGVLRSEVEVGLYRVAVQGSTLVTFGAQSVVLVFSPHFAQAKLPRSCADVSASLRLSAVVALGVAVPVTAAYVVVGRPMITWMFGQGYVSCYPALIILSLGGAVSATNSGAAALLNMRGFHADVVWAGVVSVLVNIVVSLCLIPPYGANGAAVATAVAMLVWAIMVRQKLIYRLCIDPVRVLWRTGAMRG